MCLTIPGRIVAIESTAPDERFARVDFGEVERTANLIYLPEAAVGDYVIVQAGFATRRLGAREAEEARAYHRELAALARSEAGPSPRRGPAPATSTSDGG